MENNPPLPINIGKQRHVKDIKGTIKQFIVLDEISILQSTNKKKAIYLQRIQFKDDGRIEIRLGYYIIGKNPKVLGKWVWGQFATMMPVEDFYKVYELAREKGWVTC
jgi:hypothetical protein